MSKLAVGAVVAVITILAGVLLVSRNGSEPVPFEPKIHWREPAPVCPWRDPPGDTKKWFPNGTGYKEETCVLSHLRPELERAFQKPPEPSDLSPTVFRILSEGGVTVGTVMTRRVKGEYGAIEIAVPFDLQGTIIGIKVQRHREPEKIGKELLDLKTQHQLILSNTSPTSWGEDLKVSAEAIQTGLKHLHVLYSACHNHAKVSNDHRP